MTSVSDDGNYAVTASKDHIITLWDLKNHKAKIISPDGDAASFTQGKSTEFSWKNFAEKLDYTAEIQGDVLKITQYSPESDDDLYDRYSHATEDYFGENITATSPENQYTVTYATNLVNDKSVHYTTISRVSNNFLFKLAPLSGKKLISKPKGYELLVEKINNHSSYTEDGIIALKFIDNDHYLRFNSYKPWAILYDITSPTPSKYFYLGKKPYPSVARYYIDETIDTSPTAHILVTGQHEANGIIEYSYDPITQNLKREWTPPAPNSCSWVSLQ